MPAFRCGDGEEQIDHSKATPVTTADKDAAAIRLFEDEAQSAHLFLPIWHKIAIGGKEVVQQIGELGQIVQGRLLDDSVSQFVHGWSNESARAVCRTTGFNQSKPDVSGQPWAML
jgi:hypothetical protein